MKFHWFAQQYYQKLAHEYGDEIASSWVTPSRMLADANEIGDEYKIYIRLMQDADKLGWDSLLLNEHHQTTLAMTPSPNIIAAILAYTTQNSAIALCGNSLALYNPPVRVAEEMAMLDCISGGRMIAGIVVGTPMDTTFCYGLPPIELRERFKEARELVHRAWKSEEPFAFNGKYNKLRYVNTWPRPIQEDIPVWIPGSGSPETWEVVDEFDYCYGYLSFNGKKSAEPIVNGFWDYIEAHGGNMNPHRMAFTQIICCADTDEEAERQYYDAVKYFFRQNPVAREFATPPGYSTQESQRSLMSRASIITPEQRAKAAKGELSFWEYDELGYIIAGTPERVEQRTRELCEELRIGQLITCMHVGNLSEEVALQNNRLFGEKVAPKLRDLWADQEDKWTPKISQRLVAAANAAAGR
jgi:alkanesulfonate monooxygenase SsuD/methylene tetrahydromethanopterin reductase-like flavin-dependent oxidoreductase (luciferase family)